MFLFELMCLLCSETEPVAMEPVAMEAVAKETDKGEEGPNHLPSLSVSLY